MKSTWFRISWYESGDRRALKTLTDNRSLVLRLLDALLDDSGAMDGDKILVEIGDFPDEPPVKDEPLLRSGGDS